MHPSLVITFLILVLPICHPFFGGFLLPVGILFLSVINTVILKHFYEESGRNQSKIPYIIAGINTLYLIIRIIITFFAPWVYKDMGYAFMATIVGLEFGVLLMCIVFVINLYTCE